MDHAKVGRPVAAYGSGTINELRSDTDGCLVISGGGARYLDLVQRGCVFSVANQAAVNTSAALDTAFEGLAVTNPSASSKNLVVLEFSAAQTAVNVAGAVGIAITDATGFAATIAIVNQLAGCGTVSVALADNGGTITAPVLSRLYGSVGSLATNAFGAQPGIVVDLDGSLIIQPGYTVCSYTTAACTAGFQFSFVWAEIPR